MSALYSYFIHLFTKWIIGSHHWSMWNILISTQKFTTTALPDFLIYWRRMGWVRWRKTQALFLGFWPSRTHTEWIPPINHYYITYTYFKSFALRFQKLHNTINLCYRALTNLAMYLRSSSSFMSMFHKTIYKFLIIFIIFIIIFTSLSAMINTTVSCLFHFLPDPFLPLFISVPYYICYICWDIWEH